MKFTVDEYAKQFKMSREMVHSKLKAKKLQHIIEDSIVYIVVDDNKPKEVEQKPLNKKPKITVATIISLYQKENIQLKEKIMQLESKIDKLIDDKEQMLRDERDKIEELYNKKDIQLKTILELVNTKMMLENKNETIHEVQTLEPKEKELLGEIELKEYLKTLNLKSYQKKVLKRRFLAVYDSDVRVKQKDGKLYLDFSKYDYSDLLS